MPENTSSSTHACTGARTTHRCTESSYGHLLTLALEHFRLLHRICFHLQLSTLFHSGATILNVRYPCLCDTLHSSRVFICPFPPQSYTIQKTVPTGSRPFVPGVQGERSCSFSNFSLSQSKLPAKTFPTDQDSVKRSRLIGVTRAQGRYNHSLTP